MTISEKQLELVLRARSGDQEAYGELVELNWHRLVRLARSMVGPEAAEDRVQEALLSGWRHLRRLADPAAFGSWLTRITFRQCLRRWPGASERVALDAITTPGRYGRIESDLWVEQVLHKLAPRQRAVLYLTLIEGHTDSEIAGLLGIRAGSVRAHRRRARERLEKLFGERL